MNREQRQAQLRAHRLPEWLCEEIVDIESRAEHAETELAAVRSNGGGYLGWQAAIGEACQFLTDAGCGQPGTPNTLWAMVREIIDRADSEAAAHAETRVALRLLVDAYTNAITIAPSAGTLAPVNVADRLLNAPVSHALAQAERRRS